MITFTIRLPAPTARIFHPSPTSPMTDLRTPLPYSSHTSTATISPYVHPRTLPELLVKSSGPPDEADSPQTQLTLAYSGQRVGLSETHSQWKRVVLLGDSGRIGRRRAAMSHVSCTPSSNRTCGFSRIRLSDHLHPAACAAIPPSGSPSPPSDTADIGHVGSDPPSFLGSPPGALVLAPKPHVQFAPNGPVHLMECPVAVADPEIDTPPIQDRVQLLDHHADLAIGRKRSYRFANPLTDIAARLFARPHQ